MRPRRWGGVRGARYKRAEKGGEGRRREENCVCRVSDYQKTLSVRRREKFRREQRMHGRGKGNPSANDTRQLSHKGIWMPPDSRDYVSPSRFDRVRCELCNSLDRKPGGITLSRSERAIGYRREFKTIFALTLIGILKEFSIIRKKLRKYSEDSTRNPPTSDPERIFSEL